MVDEFELIGRFFKARYAPDDGVWLGIGDDAAVLEAPPGCVVTDEMTIHAIPEGDDGFAFASFALRDAIERSRGMGGTPRWLTLALTLPEADEEWLEGFARAIRDTEHRDGVRLVGGDTTQGPGALAVCVFAVLAEGAQEEGDVANGSSHGSREEE